MKILPILNELEQTSSLNSRKDILLREKDNEQLRGFFQRVFSNKKYGVKRQFSIKSEATHETRIENLDVILSRLENNKRGIDAFMEEQLPLLNSEERELLDRIFQHDARCNIGWKIYSEIWLSENPIASYNKDVIVPRISKAQPYSKKLVDKFNFKNALIQTKMDGARCIIRVNFSKDKYEVLDPISSSGKKFLKLDLLKQEIAEAFLKRVTVDSDYDYKYDDVVLDGELLVLDKDGKISERKIGNGILNKSLKNTISDEEASRIIFVVWDLIPYRNYEEKQFQLVYYSRFNIVLKPFIQYGKNERFRLVETEQVNSLEEAMEFYQRMLQRGEEGAILKEASSIWEPKRLNNHIKLKMAVEITLKVVKVFKGGYNTKYENLMGRVLCESSDKKLQVYVGSGWSDQDRKNWVDPNYSIPEYIEVAANAIIQDTNGYSLFLPRFVGERFDKTKADDLKTIQNLFQGAISKVA